MAKQLKQFTFYDLYWKLIKSASDDAAGRIVKALCGYMFEGKEPKKLKPPVNSYYELAKTKLQLSKVRIVSGSKGGKAERVKVTDEQISNTQTSDEADISYDEFMRQNPHIQNDIYASHRHLLKGVNWMMLDVGLSKCPEYRNCTSLYKINLTPKLLRK